MVVNSTDSVHPKLINEQPSDIITAWKTLLLSSLDANASEIKIRTNTQYSLVLDTESATQKSQSTELSKLFRNNISLYETIQILAQGKITVISDQTVVHYDIEQDIAVRTTISDPMASISDPVWVEAIEDLMSRHETTGVSVCIIPDTTSNLSSKISDLKSQASFIQQVCSTDVFVNEQKVTGRNFSLKSCSRYTIDDTPVIARFTISESDTVSVYSNGVYVTEIYDTVLSGSVIFLSKLDLQTYNNIRTAEEFSQVFSKMKQEKYRLCDELSHTEYTESIRSFMSEQIFENSTNLDSVWESKYLFSSPSDSLYSLSQISSANSIGFAEYGNNTADALEERGYIILNKQDPAVQTLQKNSVAYDRAEVEDLYKKYSVQNDTRLNVSELTELQRIKLGIARYIGIKLDINRSIIYGVSTTRNAWTDGESYIVITDSATPSTKWIQWVPELFRILLHEYSHTQELLTNSPNHGNAFAQKYRKNIDTHWGLLADVIDRIDAEGLKSFDIGSTQKI